MSNTQKDRARIEDYHPNPKVRALPAEVMQWRNPMTSLVEKFLPVREGGRVFYDVPLACAEAKLASDRKGRYRLIFPAEITVVTQTPEFTSEVRTIKAFENSVPVAEQDKPEAPAGDVNPEPEPEIEAPSPTRPDPTEPVAESHPDILPEVDVPVKAEKRSPGRPPTRKRDG